MDQRSIASLHKLFEQYRIVFWYDDKKNLREDFEALELSDVTKVELNNNEFSLKYRLLRVDVGTKFLVYHEGPCPDDEHNWLLDVQLYQGQFHTDQTAIILSELNLDSKFLSLINAHLVFFDNKQRVQGLKRLLSHPETLQDFPLKMLSVCCGIGHSDFEYSMMALLEESSLEEDEKLRLIQRCSLAPYLWGEIKRRYSYENAEPGMKDFAFELFSSAFAAEIGEGSTLSRSAGVFVKNWKDIKTYGASYGVYADLCETELDIDTQLTTISFTQLLDCDLFKVVDKHIIAGILSEVKNRTASYEKVSQWIRKRKSTQWYERFMNYYEALSDASRFFTVLQGLSFSLQSLGEGVRLYSTVWKEVDRLYRSYLTNVGKVHENSLLSDLTKDIENHYNNTYLLPLSNRWHALIEQSPKWEASPIQLQRNFFTHYIKPFVDKDTKICVIISDALRYEVADELVTLVNGESRFAAEIEPML
ncbi:MAG: BREX-1 system phosphatase PglZ type A, partial [Sphaerochaeta sp.]